MEAHRQNPELVKPTAESLDLVLLRLARRGGAALAIADAYARIFDPGALVRRKAVTLLAILESAPPQHAYLNGSEVGGRISVIVSLLGWLTRGALMMGLSIVCLGPVHLGLIVRDRWAVNRGRRL